MPQWVALQDCKSLDAVIAYLCKKGVLPSGACAPQPQGPSALPGLLVAPGGGGTGPFDIIWPTAIWKTAGHGDTGVTDGIQRPPKVIYKRKTPPRDKKLIRDYRDKNKSVDRPSYVVHHKYPLFLGGPDTEPNLVFLTVSEHQRWHNDELYPQKHGWMLKDPNGTEYHVSFR